MPQLLSSVPTALTIAGSDSGGGAGLQADLKTFAFHRVHGTCAVTCVTSQNTQGVNRVDAMSVDSVLSQLNAIQSDIGIHSLKTGMLLNAEIISGVSRWLDRSHLDLIVVDPVMVSRTGAVLLEPDAVESIKTHLIPRAMIVTPNRYEAELLTGLALQSVSDIERATRRIYDLGAQSVLIKGGGLSGSLRGVDFWFDGDTVHPLETEYVETPHTHGTGCTLAAAIAANLALGETLAAAVSRSKKYVTRALKYSLAIGQGQGPVCHWHPILPEDE